MASNHDGDIELGVTLTADEAKQKAEDLAKIIHRIFTDTPPDKLTPRLQKQQSALDKSFNKLDAIYRKMQEMEDAQVPTEAYQQLENQLESLHDEQQKIIDSQLEFIRNGGDINSAEYREMESHLQTVKDNLAQCNAEMQKMRDNDAAFADLTQTQAYEDLKNEMVEVANETYIQTRAWDEAASAQTKATNPKKFQQLGQAVRQATTFVQKFIETGFRMAGLGSVIDGIKNRFGQLINKVRGVSTANNNFGNSLKQTIKKFATYALGIASLTSLFNKLRGAISWGITSMAKMNGGINQTNKAMTQLTSMLNLVKGSLAAAFTPILTVVTPMLSNFMQQLANVITMIGMFIAKVTGAKSYMKATFKSTNFAGGGSGGGGKSAQEKYDEAVKKAQEKYDKKVAETEAKNAERVAKAEEKEAKAADDLAKKQDKANNKLAAFDDINVLGVDTLEDLQDIEADLLDMPELELPSLEDFLGGGGGGTADPFGLEEVPLDDWEWNWDDLLDKARELGETLADSLNNVFKDENLAKKLGNIIGNLLNLAINFAYGFVNKFDFHQFGRWIGTLIQESIETIDWGLLGETIAKGLNGIADIITGFFETYKVGTLGDSISEMLNKAVQEIDPNLIGQAVLSVLQAPLIELSHVLTSANFALMGQKASDFIRRVFTKEGLDGQTIGQTVGKTIADLINAGVDFLLGLKLTTVVMALTTFFEDLFTTALEDVDWKDVFGLAFGRGGLLDAIMSMHQRLQYMISSLVTALASIVMEGLATLFEQLPEPVQKFLQVVPEEYHKTAEELQNTSNEMYAKFEQIKDGTITAYDEISGRADDFVYQLENIGNGFTFTAEQMQGFIDSGRFTNEQIEALIQGMEDYAEQSGTVLDKAKLGLDGYEGSWELFVTRQELRKDKLLEGHKQEEASINNLKDTTDLATTSIRDEMLDLKGQTQTFTDETNANLSSLQQNAGITVTSFEDMATQLNTSLETLTAYIQEWYDNMVATYFSYDAWTTILTEGPLLALTDFFNTTFFVTWDEQMQLWWTEHVTTWFTADKWNTDVYTPWITLFDTKWQSFITKWDSNLKVWWTNHVQPWFKEKVWEDEFMHVYKVAEKVGEKTKDKVGELAEETAEAVHNACEAMKGWIQEIIEMLGEAIEMANELANAASSAGGGGGSSSGGGSRVGGNSNGGGGGTRGFMPMLDIMHFEDNLGMSAFKFPELATGAVIPPNNEFLAVLGDQRNGVNIETPLSTMVEAFRSVMDEYMNPGMRNATMEVDGETFARLMMPHIMDEMNRLGYNTEIIEGI